METKSLDEVIALVKSVDIASWHDSEEENLDRQVDRHNKLISSLGERIGDFFSGITEKFTKEPEHMLYADTGRHIIQLGYTVIPLEPLYEDAPTSLSDYYPKFLDGNHEVFAVRYDGDSGYGSKLRDLYRHIKNSIREHKNQAQNAEVQRRIDDLKRELGR